MQQLINKLSEHTYIGVYRSYLDTGTVKDILWAHPSNIELLYAFLRVLIMDCTCKTNRYQLSLMEIVEVISTDMIFFSCFCIFGNRMGRLLQLVLGQSEMPDA